jgi:hypothetical protein
MLPSVGGVTWTRRWGMLRISGVMGLLAAVTAAFALSGYAERTVDEGVVVVSSLAVPAPVKVTAAAEAADVAPAMQTSPCWMCYEGYLGTGFLYHAFDAWDESWQPQFYATQSAHTSPTLGTCAMPDDHVHQCCEPDGEPGAPPAGSP